MFLRNCWQVAAFAAEVGRSLLSRTITGDPVLFYRTKAGEVVALEDRCPHRHVPLSMGALDGDVVQCAYHGMRFAPSGECVRVPGQQIISAKSHARAYPVVERHKMIWIWMGEADKAAAQLVPDVHWMDDEDWAVAEGYHHIDANYRLLVDNLLDLSHETFVHPETIGNAAVADSPVTVSILDDKVVCAHRDMIGAEPPPQFVALAGFQGRIDRWHTTFYMPPGLCLIEVGAVPTGSNDRSRGFAAHILNMITPETERSSHYFWGHARNIRRHETALTDLIRRSVLATFDQDKAILEAQQIACERIGTLDPQVVLGIDAGPVQGRRALAAALQNG